MARQVDYLPVATGSNPNVDPQGNFVGSGYQQSGFQTGTAISAQFNKVWRQSSMIAAAVANFISNVLNIDVIDDGNIANLIANFTKAVRQGANSQVVVAYNNNAVFDASLGNVFESTLTADMNVPTLINTIPGQKLTISIIQDAVGNHAFVPPGNLPMDAIDPTALSVSTQSFVVRSNGTLAKTSGIIVT